MQLLAGAYLRLSTERQSASTSRPGNASTTFAGNAQSGNLHQASVAQANLWPSSAAHGQQTGLAAGHAASQSDAEQQYGPHEPQQTGEAAVHVTSQPQLRPNGFLPWQPSSRSPQAASGDAQCQGPRPASSSATFRISPRPGPVELWTPKSGPVKRSAAGQQARGAPASEASGGAEQAGASDRAFVSSSHYISDDNNGDDDELEVRQVSYHDLLYAVSTASKSSWLELRPAFCSACSSRVSPCMVNQRQMRFHGRDQALSAWTPAS